MASHIIPLKIQRHYTRPLCSYGTDNTMIGNCMAIVLEDGSAMILALVLTILELWIGNVIEGSSEKQHVCV